MRIHASFALRVLRFAIYDLLYEVRNTNPTDLRVETSPLAFEINQVRTQNDVFSLSFCGVK